MSFAQSFRLAIKALLSSKMRALLTMLGIIIGVAAVIIITSLGNGMQQMMNDEFESMGSNIISVMVFAREGTSRTVEPEDMYELAEQYPQYIDSVSPYVTAAASVRSGTEEFNYTSVYGVSEDFLKDGTTETMSGESIEEGRFLSYLEVNRYQNVCVIGSHLNQDGFQNDGLGKNLSINGVPYTVVGIFEEKVDSSEGSSDDVVYIPYTNALWMNGTSSASNYMLTSKGDDTSTIAKALIETRLEQIFLSTDYFFVVTAAEMMDALTSMVDTLMVVLLAIAAISLVVGGIGIMNIMLVSVTERTREIGIRKSLGAKGRDIRSQFLIEAGTTSAIGGILGILLGVGFSGAVGGVISAFMEGADGYSAIPTTTSVMVSFGISVAIGVFFGYTPANKAAKLNPIDALRYD